MHSNTNRDNQQDKSDRPSVYNCKGRISNGSPEKNQGCCFRSFGDCFVHAVIPDIRTEPFMGDKPIIQAF